MKKLEKIILLIVLLLGIGLRSVEVLNRNFLFGFDQGRDYLEVERMVRERKPTLIGSEIGAGFAGLGGIFHGPYYYYSLLVPYFLFRGDPYGGLVLMFLFGVAALLINIFVAKHIFGTRVALVVGFLTAVSPPLTSQSRFMWNHHPTTFFIPFVFLFVSLIRQRADKFLFLASFVAGLIYGFELAISIPLLVTIYIYTFFVLKIRQMRVYLWGIFGAILAHLPFFVFEARHGFMAIKGIFSLVSKQVAGQGTIQISNLFAWHLIDFWNNFRNTFLLPGNLPFLVMLVIGYLAHHSWQNKRKNDEQTFLLFLCLLLPVSFVIFLFLNNLVWDYYLTHLHLAYIFVFAYFVAKVTTKKQKLVLTLFMLAMLPGVYREINRARADYFDFGGTAKIKGKIEAVDYLYQDAGGQKFDVLIFTSPVYDYPYRYLFNWYGERKYGLIPGNEKKGRYYLLIEPEPTQLWLHKGWLETVIGEGKTLKEVNLPNGFIIHQRSE